MTAREEIVAALAAMQARLDAATGGPWHQDRGYIEANGDKIATVLHAGRYVDADLTVDLRNREQRVIDHVTDVLARHDDYGDGTCTGCHPLGTRQAPDCPEVASVHAMVVGP